jgi:hypothetical protein
MTDTAIDMAAAPNKGDYTWKRRQAGQFRRQRAPAPFSLTLFGQGEQRNVQTYRSANTKLPLVPPKPNEFFTAYSIFISRATLAQKSSRKPDPG